MKHLAKLPRTNSAPAILPPLCPAPQYDVELYQKIEALIGLQMEAYPAEQEAVLLLLERVGEAQRIATMQASPGVHCAGLAAVGGALQAGRQAESGAGWACS